MTSSADPSTVEILLKVNAAARAIRKARPGLSSVEARVAVWEEHPDLHVELRKAQERETNAARGLAGKIDEILTARAMQISAQQDQFVKTLSQIRTEIRESPIGREIMALRRAAMSGKVKSLYGIPQGSEHATAAATLREWESDPSVGLRQHAPGFQEEDHPAI